MSKLPIYVIAKAANTEGLQQELQRLSVDGYRALFPVECNDGKMVVVMQREPQAADGETGMKGVREL